MQLLRVTCSAYVMALTMESRSAASFPITSVTGAEFESSAAARESFRKRLSASRSMGASACVYAASVDATRNAASMGAMALRRCARVDTNFGR